MNKNLGLVFTLLFCASAQAIPVTPTPVEVTSPALQLARRVASMENNKDLPSRAVWLGKKAAYNARLAYEAKPPQKNGKRKTVD